MPAEGSSRSVLAVRRTGRPGPRSNYELFNCNNLNIRYWSWNYRGCKAQDLRSNGSLLRDLDCTHFIYEIVRRPVLLFIVTASPY